MLITDCDLVNHTITNNLKCLANRNSYITCINAPNILPPHFFSIILSGFCKLLILFSAFSRLYILVNCKMFYAYDFIIKNPIKVRFVTTLPTIRPTTLFTDKSTQCLTAPCKYS